MSRTLDELSFHIGCSNFPRTVARVENPYVITKWTSVVVLVRLVYNGLQGLPCPPVLLRDWQGFFFLVR